MNNALEIKDLKKSYGNFEALKGISFDVKENEIFALIGPNGAGKTTTLRIIATILKPTSGNVNVYGFNAIHDADNVRKVISYLPEEAGAYKNLRGLDYLDFMASLFAPDKRTHEDYIQTAIEVSDLKDRLNDKVSTYSKGMTRKLLLARALMSKPKLAILDEPTSGLDVTNAIEIRQTIKKFASRGMAVLVSSHNMLEIEYLSDRVAIIEKGVIHASGTPSELKEKYNSANLEEVFVEVVK